MFVVMIWAGGTMLAWISSGVWAAAGEMGVFSALAAFNTMTIETGGSWGIPKQVTDFVEGIVTMFGWYYPFLDSEWAILIKIPLWVCSIGVIWGVVQVAFSAVNGLLSSLRSFISPVG
jgi:hypothetical protein